MSEPSDSPLTQADHDRLAILERLAMTPTERVRANAAMYAVWVRGQQNLATAKALLSARTTDGDDDASA